MHPPAWLPNARLRSVRTSGRRALAPHSRITGPCSALVDFDGTIAPNDPTDRLLERFAHPAWRDIEAEWQAGRISSRQCMQQQAALLRATPQQLDAAIRDIGIDPDFHAFLAFCRRRGVGVAIVSDGFDRVVRAVLKRAGLSLPFFANKLAWQGGDRWRLELPHASASCRSEAANCKCSHAAQQGRRVVIGDGRSDFCMASGADYVIAKGALLDFCRSRALPHAPFGDFGDATHRLTQWLDGLADAPASLSSRLGERADGATPGSPQPSS
jgi:2-hydroxy-3-keto-5-methylthiopentenyl-1-phosphate phosphatase